MENQREDKTKFHITASGLGPIESLSGELSGEKRNLIFANNGLGKSFISRTLSLLGRSDLDEDHRKVIINNLVRQEQQDGKGLIEIKEGQDLLAKISLDKKTSEIEIEEHQYIFAVFNSEYVQKEVRESKDYAFSEFINGELIIGKYTAELEEERANLETEEEKYKEIDLNLSNAFTKEKNTLIDETTITRNLSDYQNLKYESLKDENFKPRELISSSTTNRLKESKDGLKNYDEIDDDADKPNISTFIVQDIDQTEINKFLKKVVSLYSINEEYKNKINKKIDFVESATVHFIETIDSNECPYCEQKLHGKSKDMVDVYVTYFTNEEAKSKKICRIYQNEISDHTNALQKLCDDVQVNIAKFDALKPLVAELKGIKLTTIKSLIEELVQLNVRIEDLILTKFGNLDDKFDVEKELEIQKNKRFDIKNKIESVFSDNATKINQMNAIINSKTQAKLIAKRKVCKMFEEDFYSRNEEDFKSLKKQTIGINRLKVKIENIKQSSLRKIQIDGEVTITFARLIPKIFGNKYHYNPDDRKLSFDHQGLKRKAENTFSDGEKNIIGLIYFISSLHTRVSRKSDYKKLFLIIDDPVSSLSFNNIYGVLDVLRNLRYSEDEGIICENSNDGHVIPILLLTHNDHLFNMALGNNVFKGKSAFQLELSNGNHDLFPLNNIITPHYAQLRHVYAVANGHKPEFYTSNSIRSVLEGMWKFHRPDLKNLTLFIEVMESDVISTKRILINSMSHGGHHYDASQFDSDIRIAAAEAIAVVERLAPGQINMINNS